jgi:hypothetical protein
VDNFVDSVASDLVYTWSMDLTGNYTIQFGDGVSGSMVPNGSDVQMVTYNTGGGSANAVGPDGLTTGLSNVVDTGTGTLVSLTAYNAVAAVPGGNAETTAQIKARAPISVQAPRCLLTRIRYSECSRRSARGVLQHSGKLAGDSPCPVT